MCNIKPLKTYIVSPEPEEEAEDYDCGGTKVIITILLWCTTGEPRNISISAIQSRTAGWSDNIIRVNVAMTLHTTYVYNNIVCITI